MSLLHQEGALLLLSVPRRCVSRLSGTVVVPMGAFGTKQSACSSSSSGLLWAPQQRQNKLWPLGAWSLSCGVARSRGTLGPSFALGRAAFCSSPPSSSSSSSSINAAHSSDSHELEWLRKENRQLREETEELRRRLNINERTQVAPSRLRRSALRLAAAIDTIPRTSFYVMLVGAFVGSQLLLALTWMLDKELKKQQEGNPDPDIRNQEQVQQR
ncbi:hypothetical protein QOT17_007426 [Balamuthia mandrillaris]